MDYHFDEIIDRRGTNSVKLDAAKRNNPYLPDSYIPLWIADMDFACAPQILDAMRRRLEKRILGYSMLGKESYDAVVNWMQRRHGWTIRPEEIAFSSGVVTALYAAVEHLTQPQDEVLIMTPAYHPFDDAVKRFGRKPLYNRMILRNGRYEIDFDDFEKKASRPECTLFFLCNPQNPTGRVFSKDELLQMGEICFANNVFVVNDEIHADLIRTGQKHISFASLFPTQKRVITCTSPSKSFNIAGNRHSALIIPDEAIRAEWADNCYCGHPGPLAIDAAIAAYNEAEDWLEALKRYLDDSFAAMDTFIREHMPRARFSIPEGTYLGWVDLSAYGLSEDALIERVSRAGVYVQFGRDFVDNGDCHMRVNIACPRAVLLEAMSRIASALES